MTRTLPVLATLLLSSLASAQLTCFSDPAGSSCGPTLAVTFTPIGGGNFDMQMLGRGLHPHTAGLFVWGANPANIQLPNGCSILTDFIWGHSFMTDPNGEATWSRSWPHWATITFRMQMASVQFDTNGGFTALTTECRLAGCL